MALTHVCVWKDNKWNSVSLEAAVKQYERGVSSKNSPFSCEICGQKVTLAVGPKRKYFKHEVKSDIQDKECEDRSKQYETSGFGKISHNLPIRLNVKDNDFTFEMGFISLPVELDSNAAIIITANSKNGTAEYKYSAERLNENGTTYLSVGNYIAQEYTVKFENVNNINIIRKYWPEKIHGIDPVGTVFDRQTGKMLPRDADVCVDREYYILTMDPNLYVNGVLVNKKAEKIENRFEKWFLYSVTAQKYLKSVAEFFMNYHCRLTENPAQIQMLWPAHSDISNFLYHNEKANSLVFIHISGNVKNIKTDPQRYTFDYELDDAKLISFRINDGIQYIAAGRIEVLRYCYLQKKERKSITELPNVSVVDLKGLQLTERVYDRLPYKNSVVVVPTVDGYLTVRKKGRIIYKTKLKSGERCEINNISFGQEISVYQGLDIVWKTEFKKIIAESVVDEELLLRNLKNCRGKNVKISHYVGSVAEYLQNMPKIKSWLHSKIKRGYIEEDALKMIRDITGGKV